MLLISGVELFQEDFIERGSPSSAMSRKALDAITMLAKTNLQVQRLEQLQARAQNWRSAKREEEVSHLTKQIRVQMINAYPVVMRSCLSYVQLLAEYSADPKKQIAQKHLEAAGSLFYRWNYLYTLKHSPNKQDEIDKNFSHPDRNLNVSFEEAGSLYYQFLEKLEGHLQLPAIQAQDGIQIIHNELFLKTQGESVSDLLQLVYTKKSKEHIVISKNGECSLSSHSSKENQQLVQTVLSAYLRKELKKVLSQKGMSRNEYENLVHTLISIERDRSGLSSHPAIQQYIKIFNRLDQDLFESVKEKGKINPLPLLSHNKQELEQSKKALSEECTSLNNSLEYIGEKLKRHPDRGVYLKLQKMVQSLHKASGESLSELVKAMITMQEDFKEELMPLFVLAQNPYLEKQKEAYLQSFPVDVRIHVMDVFEKLLVKDQGIIDAFFSKIRHQLTSMDEVLLVDRASRRIESTGLKTRIEAVQKMTPKEEIEKISLWMRILVFLASIFSPQKLKDRYDSY